MSTKQLIEQLTGSVKDVPSAVEVLNVRQYSHQDMAERVRSILGTGGEIAERTWDRGDWVVEENRTLIRLHDGGRAVIFHASGAMKLVSGLEPMASPFARLEDPKRLTRMAEEAAGKLRLKSWAGQNGDIRFERLWQIKAAGGDREGKVTDPTLFRIVGAYRHFVRDIPVWGPASVAIKLAGGGTLDSLTIVVREPEGKAYERVKTLPPDHGARQIAGQLTALMGPSDISLDKVVRPQWMHFGYLSLSKRKAQRWLEPVYVALVDVEAGEEAQGYLLVTPAAEKSYMPVCRIGAEAVTPPASRAKVG